MTSMADNSNDDSWASNSVTWVKDDDTDSGSSTVICQLPKAPYLPVSLSEREEEILVVQNLPTRVEPNNETSKMVNRAIAKYTKRVEQQFKIIENQFQSVNADIENQIFNASQRLYNDLKSMDQSLSNILEDQHLNTYTQLDVVQSNFVLLDGLINERNRKIDDFMDALRDLEKQRTTLVQNCYKRHMVDNRQQPNNSIDHLYKQYLKNYNKVKLGNFRTYEDLRFKLVQLTENYRLDFAYKVHEVKLKTIKSIGNSFKEKFITDIKMIISKEISTFQTKSINFLNDLIDLFNELMNLMKEKKNITFILKRIELFKKYSIELDEIINSIKPCHDEVLNEVQLLLTKTIEEYAEIIKNSGEYLEPLPSILTATINEISIEANYIQQEKIKTLLDVQLFLSNVKNSIRIANMVLSPTLDLIYDHSKRLKKTKKIVLIALENKIKINDIKLNIFENRFNVELNMLIQASNESIVKVFEKKCYFILAYILNRVQFNKDSELDILTSYNEIIKHELELVRSEFQILFNIYPTSLKRIPEFDNLTQNNAWTETINRSITSFKNIAKTFQNTIYIQFSTLFSEFNFNNLVGNELAWISFLKQCINQRFDVGIQLNKHRISRVRNGVVKKRLDEIEQHRILLDRHVKAVQEKIESLKYKTNMLYETFNSKKVTIINNVELAEINVNSISLFELADIITKLKKQIHSVAVELNNLYKSHDENIKSKFREMADFTLAFMKSIRTFPGGGNYGHAEAVNVISALHKLSKIMAEKQTDIIEMLKFYNYKSVYEIEETLSHEIKSLMIELDKKKLSQKHSLINKLMIATVNQEILNLDKTIDSLRKKLHLVEKTFKKNDTVESSKCWSEILSETKVFMGFLLESYNDLKALAKSDTKNSIWNTDNLKDYIVYRISPKLLHNNRSTPTIKQQKATFYDYSQIISSSQPVENPTFLNNIYMAIYHYLSESQINAMELAIIDSKNTWITSKSDPTHVYHEIMLEAINRIKEIILQCELIWIFKLTDFFNFLNNFNIMEAKFKNIILMTYHEESVKKLDDVFYAFKCESKKVRIHLKTVCEKFRYKLKPSYGHFHNISRLEDLMADFRHIKSECWSLLSKTYIPIKDNFKEIGENYKKQYPLDVLKAVSLYIKCLSNLKNQLSRINLYPAIDTGYGFERILKSQATQIFVKDTIELALKNILQQSQLEDDIVLWPNNEKLWTDNVNTFANLYNDRYGDVKTFKAVEKSKLVDWAEGFFRDIIQVKKLHPQNKGCIDVN